MGELDTIRASVIEAGRLRWETLLGEVPGPVGKVRPEVGAHFALTGIDPTSQGPHDTGRAILHRTESAQGQRLAVAIPMDMVWAQRVGRMREVQALLGFRREDRWDAIVTVLEARTELEAPELVVELGPIFVRGQLLLEREGAVPGLDQAVASLDKLQAGIAVPNATEKPADLLPLLYRILATHHWRAFRELCDASASTSDKKVTFDQFRHAWEAAQGEIQFEGYVEPQSVVVEAVEGTVVRTRHARRGEKGESLSHQVKWVKRGPGWRLAGGLL
jgi:hypothetical protein